MAGLTGYTTQKTDVRLAIMTTVIVAIFIIGHIIRSIVWILVYFKIGLENELYYLGPIQNCLLVFNSSINFVIYYNFNKKFKDTFINLFSRKHKSWQQIQMQGSQFSNIEQQTFL